jgi:hypothetical protein
VKGAAAVGSAVTAGLLFAACQVGYFVRMEFSLSSTYVSYYATIGVWLLGALVGLAIRGDRTGGPLLLAGLAAYYLAGAVLARAPYDFGLLPLYGLCIFTTALYSGHFFRRARRSFGSANSLFFHENNGFLLGYLLAVAQLLLHGQVSQQILPAVLAAAHLLCRLAADRAGEAGAAAAPAAAQR